MATVYVVNGGATLLHEHDRLGMWLPPGGHVDRDELPHGAAAREVREETGLAIDLLAPIGDVDTGFVRSIPAPLHLHLEDINVHGDAVGHQHVDFVFYGEASSRVVNPASDEAPASAWRCFEAVELATRRDQFVPDVIDITRRALDRVEGSEAEGSP